jgi:hypothetical protein
MLIGATAQGIAPSQRRYRHINPLSTETFGSHGTRTGSKGKRINHGRTKGHTRHQDREPKAHAIGRAKAKHQKPKEKKGRALEIPLLLHLPLVHLPHRPHRGRHQRQRPQVRIHSHQPIHWSSQHKMLLLWQRPSRKPTQTKVRGLKM